MAESTITKILLRRGPKADLKLSESDNGAVLDLGEPGFTTDTFRLYIGDGTNNIPIPRTDDVTIIYDSTGALQLNPNTTAQIKTGNAGSGCGNQAAICATNGGIYAKRDINCAADVVSFCSSDERLKTNIKLIEQPLEKLSHVQGVTFDWNDKQQTYTGSDTGVIAQHVEKTELPGLVDTRDTGYKAVKYERLVPLLVESIKSLEQRVQQLEKLVQDKDGLQ